MVAVEPNLYLGIYGSEMSYILGLKLEAIDRLLTGVQIVDEDNKALRDVIVDV